MPNMCGGKNLGALKTFKSETTDDSLRADDEFKLSK